MDIKARLATAKTKIKNRAPEIAGFAIVVVTAAGTLALKHLHDAQSTDLRVTLDDLAIVRDGDSDMRYSVLGDDYALKYIGKTPQD